MTGLGGLAAGRNGTDVSSAMADGLSDRRAYDAADEARDEQSLKPLSLRASNDRRPPPPPALTETGSLVAAGVLQLGHRAGGDGDDDDDSPADSSSLKLAILLC